jgi:hypothetical protein
VAADDGHRRRGGSPLPGTAQLYRGTLDRDVLPGVGELRVQEATVPRLDVFVQALRDRTGASTAKVAYTVLSGMLGLAVRHGALTCGGGSPTGLEPVT